MFKLYNINIVEKAFGNTKTFLSLQSISDTAKNVDLINWSNLDHSSISRIKIPSINETLSFTQNLWDKCKDLNVPDTKKASGFGTIPPKLVRKRANVLCQPLPRAIDNSLLKGVFPGKTKIVLFIHSGKETLAQVFSCEFCKISKNTFFTEHLWMTASDDHLVCYI